MIKLPEGFLANGVSCGLKKSGKLDLALIYSKVLSSAAGVFTVNKVKAACLKITAKNIKNGKAQAVIINSGNANCFTGKNGLADAGRTGRITAKKLGLKQSDLLVSSTGIIGKRLPVDKIKKAIPKLIKGLSRSGLKKAARAILTTDTKIKLSAKKIRVGNKSAQIVGIAKGAGMIAPNMKSATMLCFILTDIAISADLLKKALAEATDSSFNSITIDGCMSTNDMVLVLANGLARNKSINKTNTQFMKFKKALGEVCLDLAKQIIKDGEGATKFIEIDVSGARSADQAKKGAFSIANSVLFKTAMHGENPNWGRIISALGQSGIDFKEERIKISASPLKKKEIKVLVNLGMGNKKASVYTADLSPKYVKINAEYN